MKVVFIHPDLGIGGAERLVVDAAVALQSKQHNVQFVTNHHSPEHCFQETRDGTLKVTVVGQSIPRNIFGKFSALCAYLRMMYAAYFLVFQSEIDPDIIFCDQISACIPILKWSRARVIFYCHFPDQLLTKRENILKKLYRAPLDWLEEYTTGRADIILVNSNFTAGVFRKTFPSLICLPIRVLYPSLNFQSFDKPLEGDLSNLKLQGIRTVFLSINRYERKKNLELALYAMEKLIARLGEDKDTVHLIVAGGYDPRVSENIEYHEELQHLSKSELGLEKHVTFLKSPSDKKKQLLLHSCTALLYTPENEHFGIVPLEAMYMFRPVVAANSGGPTETVVDEETGFLREPDADAFADAMLQLVKDHSLARDMGKEAHNRVKLMFSYKNFMQHLETIVQDSPPKP